MKEFTAQQIAAALAGHPGCGEQELRLLRLFQSNVSDPVEVERDATRESLAKAA